MNTLLIFVFVGVVCSVSNFLLISAGKPVFAVSSFADLEQHYVNMKRSNPSLSCPRKEKGESKEDICAAIFSSPYFFDVHRVHYVHANESIRSKMNATKAATAKDKKSYTLQEIDVRGESFPEFAYPCSPWNRTSKKFEDYFISCEYPTHVQNTSVRFVFGYNERKKLVVTALVEEPAKISNVSSRGYLYESGEYNEKRSDALKNLEKSSRGICNLTETLMARLCAVVLNTKAYREKVKFPSSKDVIVAPKCEKYELLLKYKIGDVWEVSFAEWAIECKAVQIASGLPTIYLISPALEQDEFFISRKIGDKNVVVDHCRTPHFFFQ